MNRRQFSQMLSGLGVAALCPSLGWSAVEKQAINSGSKNRTIMLKSIHTGEAGEFKYLIDGQLMRPELERLFHLLRDHRTGDVHPMDSKLLEQLYQLQQSHRASQPFQVISGYRSPKTNTMLSGASNGVAKKSLHMQGKAIDINLPGTSLDTLHASARKLKAGGVGKYSQSGFIHIDTGRVRFWGS